MGRQCLSVLSLVFSAPIFSSTLWLYKVFLDAHPLQPITLHSRWPVDHGLQLRRLLQQCVCSENCVCDTPSPHPTTQRSFGLADGVSAFLAPIPPRALKSTEHVSTQYQLADSGRLGLTVSTAWYRSVDSTFLAQLLRAPRSSLAYFGLDILRWKKM